MPFWLEEEKERSIRASARQLKKLCERRLDGYDVVVLILDGKTFGSDEMVIALGLTSDGRKIPSIRCDR